MKKQPVITRALDEGEKKDGWKKLFNLTFLATILLGLLGGWLAFALVADPFLLPVSVVIGALVGGCLGFSACVLIAVRFGWLDEDGRGNE